MREARGTVRITIAFSPEEEAEFREQAGRRGMDIGEYVKLLARGGGTRQNPNGYASPDGYDYGPAAGNLDPTGHRYDPAAAREFLRALSETDAYGAEEEQQETFDWLQKAVDEDRPGQRSIFGKGVNPYLPDIIAPTLPESRE